ncbi:rhodopsin, GQ-coupled [Trichonephila inaurata madagascariensis]|uniref:Rhodopsin, GQ-coupled n=1 Tax=Trichonephila inaurata madagascariensis TaxID=2747483 RepID=A0A8X7C1C8_9ARAC|nr:rhodopsin, GQ-coupled [Trichonephila inaurata madagascariensis]
MGSLCDEARPLLLGYGDPNASGAVFRHWCEQTAVPWAAHCAVGVLLVLICAFSVAGNLLVVVVFTRYRRLRSPANTLIVNLALSDMLNGLLHPMAAYSSFRGVWSFGRAGCEAYAALCGLLGLVSIVTLTAIALERCLVISVKPWHGAVLFTHSKAKGAIGIVWIYCLALVMPPLTLGWGAFVPEGFLTSCSFDYLSRSPGNRAYFLFLFCFGFFLPVLIIGICYTFILQTIFQNERDMKLKHVTKINRSKVKKSEYRAAEMILMVIALFLISWTPYSLIACLGQFGDRSLLTPWGHIEKNGQKEKQKWNILQQKLIGQQIEDRLSLLSHPWGASDMLESSSSSLTGKKIYMDHQNNSTKREKLCTRHQHFPLKDSHASNHASKNTLHRDNIVKLRNFEHKSRDRQKSRMCFHEQAAHGERIRSNPGIFCEGLNPIPISCQSFNDFVNALVNEHGKNIEKTCYVRNPIRAEFSTCIQDIPRLSAAGLEIEDMACSQIKPEIEQLSNDAGSILSSECLHTTLRSFPENSSSLMFYKSVDDDSIRRNSTSESGNISQKQSCGDHFKICVLNFKHGCQKDFKNAITKQQKPAENYSADDDSSSSQEKIPECARHVKATCESKYCFSSDKIKSINIPQWPDGLIRSLMFRSEQSIHQKYQMLLEKDHIMKVPTMVCFRCNSRFISKTSELPATKSSFVLENRKAVVILNSGHLKEVFRCPAAK